MVDFFLILTILHLLFWNESKIFSKSSHYFCSQRSRCPFLDEYLLIYNSLTLEYKLGQHPPLDRTLGLRRSSLMGSICEVTGNAFPFSERKICLHSSSRRMVARLVTLELLENLLKVRIFRQPSLLILRRGI